jgi:hypothetical protein
MAVLAILGDCVVVQPASGRVWLTCKTCVCIRVAERVAEGLQKNGGYTIRSVGIDDDVLSKSFT